MSLLIFHRSRVAIEPGVLPVVVSISQWEGEGLNQSDSHGVQWLVWPQCSLWSGRTPRDDNGIPRNALSIASPCHCPGSTGATVSYGRGPFEKGENRWANSKRGIQAVLFKAGLHTSWSKPQTDEKEEEKERNLYAYLEGWLLVCGVAYCWPNCGRSLLHVHHVHELRHLWP